MTDKEKKLTALFLRLASDEFGNHGCNDVPEKYFEGWTKEERQQFVKEIHEWNGDPEEYNPEFLHTPDFAIFGFLAHKIENS